MTKRDRERVDREIKCLRQMLRAVAGRKFPWCGAADEQCRREGISLAMRLRAKFQERQKGWAAPPQSPS